jgi:hypothetical protein
MQNRVVFMWVVCTVALVYIQQICHTILYEFLAAASATHAAWNTISKILHRKRPGSWIDSRDIQETFESIVVSLYGLNGLFSYLRENNLIK